MVKYGVPTWLETRHHILSQSFPAGIKHAIPSIHTAPN